MVQSNEILAAELVQQNAKLEAAGIALDFFAEVDDGTGLPEGYRRGRGLTSMETRARNLGGALTIDSGPEGTRLSLEVPVSATASAD